VHRVPAKAWASCIRRARSKSGSRWVEAAGSDTKDRATTPRAMPSRSKKRGLPVGDGCQVGDLQRLHGGSQALGAKVARMVVGEAEGAKACRSYQPQVARCGCEA
jgi:hypothetical protein